MSSSINNNNNNTFRTREQLIDDGLFWSKPFSILKEVYVAMHNGCLDNIHIYHSDVYYVRMVFKNRGGHYESPFLIITYLIFNHLTNPL